MNKSTLAAGMMSTSKIKEKDKDAEIALMKQTRKRRNQYAHRRGAEVHHAILVPLLIGSHDLS